MEKNYVFPVNRAWRGRGAIKGVILAGGTGSRLYPLTRTTNKHLLQVGKYPMIYHSIFKLAQAHIQEILIVTGREHMREVVNLLGSGQQFGVSFTYKIQGLPGGIAQALGLAKSFAGEDSIVVLLGDNVFEESITGYVNTFIMQGKGAKILLKEVQDSERYGVAELSGGCIISIEEKPKRPRSSFAVTGIYMFDRQVFDMIDQLTPSARGEYEITDINNSYLQKQQLSFDVLRGWWTDAGTPPSFQRANELAKDLDFGEIFG
jgi:glucose-1-phosphate thymidylyltransferase